MKKQLCILGLLGFMGLQAQTGKVGVNTETPTEILDVNGTVRVRSLPAEGTVGIHTTGTNTASDTANQTFTPTKFVVADENGVLGVSTSQQLGDITNGNASNATADNNSTAMFVKKIYRAADWPSGRNGATGADTGFSTDKWEAILTITKFGRIAGDAGNEFLGKKNSGTQTPALQLDIFKNGGTWRIMGDIPDIEEEWEFTVLFINKNYIVADENRISI